jgi:hypothetical protein
VEAQQSPPELAVSSADGQSTLRFQLASQIRWQLRLDDIDSTGPSEQDNKILFRRIRPIISGNLGTEDFAFKLHLNLVPGALELMDLWLDYRFHPQLALRLGQAKIPYTRYRLGSFTTRPVVDWSFPTQFFGAERQMGAMLHNGVGNPPRFEYQLGVYTGTNARVSNAVALPLLYDSERRNLSNLVQPSPPTSFHPEIVAHVAYNHPDLDSRTPQDFEGGPPRFSFGLSGAWDLRPVATQDLTLRLAPEAVLKLYGVTLWALFQLGFWNDSQGPGDTDLGLLSTVAQASYVFLERFEVGARYTNVIVLSELRRDARAQATSRINGAADEDTRQALAEQLAPVGTLKAEHEVNLGFNLYLWRHALKLGTDGGLIIHERTDGRSYDVVIRIQTQVAF